MKRENAVRKFEKKEKKISAYSQDFMIELGIVFDKIAILIATSHVMLIIYFKKLLEDNCLTTLRTHVSVAATCNLRYASRNNIR